MKRKLLLLLIALLCTSSVLSASSVSFVFGDLDQHAEILGGFLPSYIKLGAGYTGFSILEGHKTQLSLLVGGGYSQRKVWQNPSSGRVQDHDPIIYDTARVDWELRFEQGFFDSTVEGKDLLTVRLAYLGRFDMNMDSMKKGETRANPSDYTIRSLEGYLGTGYNGEIYPDLRGNGQHLGTAFKLRLLVDMMDDEKMYANGWSAYFDAEWAPLALNSALDGVADYYTLTFNTVGAWTPYSFVEDGQHWFSLTLIDRFNFSWTDGSDVPVYAQLPVSLGRKVRGYTSWTYNTQFTMVNNFDIRFAGPAWNAIFPRVNLFFDVGYGCGDYFNTENGDSNVLMSTGIQLTMSFFDFIDLGYQIAYIFGDGYNFVSGADVNVTGKFTFFLDF